MIRLRLDGRVGWNPVEPFRARRHRLPSGAEGCEGVRWHAWRQPTLHRPTKLRTRFTWTVFLLSFLTICAIWWIDRQLSGPLRAWAELRAEGMATRAVYTAIQEILAAQIGEEDVIRLIPGDGNQTAWTYDWGLLHRVDSELTQRIHQALQAETAERIPVPVGEILGVDLFSAAGPFLPVRVLAAGRVATDVRFDFRSQGINQVLHEIYVHVDIDMRVIAPLIEESFAVSQRVPLSTILIQGEVPPVFVNWSGGLGDLQASWPVQ